MITQAVLNLTAEYGVSFASGRLNYEDMKHLHGLDIAGLSKEQKRNNIQALYEWAGKRVTATDARGYKTAIVEYIAAQDRLSAAQRLPVGTTVKVTGTSTGTEQSQSLLLQLRRCCLRLDFW
jgi:hypothetical protein